MLESYASSSVSDGPQGDCRVRPQHALHSSSSSRQKPRDNGSIPCNHTSSVIGPMSSHLLLTAAGARPLDGAEIEGSVSVHFDSTVKSQVVRVGETRAAVSATSLGLNCSSRLRFVVLQIAPVGAGGSSFELHMRVRCCHPLLPCLCAVLRQHVLTDPPIKSATG